MSYFTYKLLLCINELELVPVKLFDHKLLFIDDKLESNYLSAKKFKYNTCITILNLPWLLH